MSDSDVIRDDLCQRYHRLVQDYGHAQTQVTQLQQQMATIQQLAQEHINAAARIYGFDLLLAYQQWNDAQVLAAAEAEAEALLKDMQFDAAPAVVQPPTAQPAAQIPPAPPAKRLSIKEMVLEAAKQAYPNPVRASALRNQLASQGITVHEKTIGMTLYRWSSTRAIRREGTADWFFVPEAERNVAAPSEGKPGDQPRQTVVH